MNRQIDSIRFRIQRELTIMDDEIERFRNLSNSYTSKINELKDKINIIDQQCGLIDQELKGKKLRIESAFGTLSSRQNSIRTLEIAELQKIHDQNIRFMQDAFQQRMTEINQKYYMQTNAKIASIQKRINKLTEFNKSLTKRLTSLSKEELRVNTVNEGDVIFEARKQELQKTLIQLGNERHENLRQNKMKLSKCIDELEHNENQFRFLQKEKLTTITSMDYRYQLELKNVEHHHRSKMEILQKKLRNIESFLRSKESVIESVKIQGSFYVTQAMNDFNNLKNNPKVIDNDDEPSFEDQTVNLLSQLEKKRKILSEREVVLQNSRQNNMNLKRQLAELKHQAKFGVH